MAKKAKAVKKKAQLVVDDLLVGETIPDLHGEDVEITEDLVEQMHRFEQGSNTHALWKNKITGSFLFWRMNEEKKAETIEELEEQVVEELEEEGWGTEEEDELDEAIEEEVVSDEDLMLDAKEDYAIEYNIKGGAEKVNTGSKKFKAFFEKFKESE